MTFKIGFRPFVLLEMIYVLPEKIFNTVTQKFAIPDENNFGTKFFSTCFLLVTRTSAGFLTLN